MERDWIVAPAVPEAEAASLVHALGVPRIGAELLLRRGVSSPETATRFLDPRLKALRDPFGLPDMDRAVERAWQAIDRKEPILVHGDYDVDGIVGTSFLLKMLRELKADVSYFLPERVKDGYGLGPAGLAEARRRGARLIIAVDCGVTANEPAEEARRHGIDLIVLDHHQPPPVLPNAVAVVDAMREDATYPFTGLCGVGVAAKFIQGMAMTRRGSLDPLVYVDALSLVALGTIADVVPLTDENRTFVVHGLRALSRSEWPGIVALRNTAKLSPGIISASQVAFQLAPRLNATGRMGKASLGVDLLLADTLEQAEALARDVVTMNTERREADQRVTLAAKEQVEAFGEVPPMIVLWSNDWPAGVIGIAAARVAETFRRPTLLISMEGDVGRGSARSFGGFDVGRSFAEMSDILIAHGGHSQAAGLTVHRDRLDELFERLCGLVRDAAPDTDHQPLTLDADLQPEDLDTGLLDFLDRLGPFGAGCPEPLFLLRDLKMMGPPRIVGDGHLRLRVTNGRQRMTAIGFNLAQHAEELARGGGRATLAATPALDEYAGEGAIQLRFRDVRAGA